MASTSLPVTLDDVVAAQELLSSIIRPTPLELSRALSERVGSDVHLKCENLQRAGSFKIRGAYTRMSRLSDEEKARGVVAASAGNHAQGVALAAKLLGIRSTVFMPLGAPIPKLMATRGYGAEVEQLGTSIDECLVRARQFETETGAVLIHPFDHPDIVAGQGTCGLEILEQCPDVSTIVVSAGGADCWPVSRLPSRTGGPTCASSECRHRAQPRTRRPWPPAIPCPWPRWPRWPMASRSVVRVRCRTRSSVSWSTRSRRLVRTRCRGQCCSCSSGPSSSSNRLVPRPWPDCSMPAMT